MLRVTSRHAKVGAVVLTMIAVMGVAEYAMADYAAAVLADNPMGYWRFNDPIDSDTAVNLGTLGASLDGTYNDVDRAAAVPDEVNGVPIIGMGPDNKAIGVGPDISFVSTDESPLSDMAEFSMSGWVRVEELLNNRIGLFGQNDAPEFGFINPNTIQMWTPGGGSLNYDIGLDPDVADTIENGEWFHLATVATGDEILLYFDGEEVEVGGTVTDNYGASDFTFAIGGGGVYDAPDVNDGNQFTGGFDEVAIWDVALTPEQIKAQYDAAFTPAVGGPALQAGDADRNLEFNQLDLVMVQIAAKYLTGQPATWGEGDWNGAPGGSPEAPPAGDGLFNQLDIIAALNADVYLTGPYAALAGEGALGDDQTSIVYNVGTGELAVNAPASTELTSINIDSASGIFTGDPAENLGGSFDNDADNNIFKATFGGSFGSLSFGNVAQTGLSKEFVLNDLTAVGSLAGGGDLGAVDLIYVPEPSSLVLLGLGMVAALMLRRRRRS